MYVYVIKLLYNIKVLWTHLLKIRWIVMMIL